VNEIRVVEEIAVPRQTVWERVSDHESTQLWVADVRKVQIVKEGAPDRRGLGAIRTVEFRPVMWTTVHEEITLWDPPHAFHYVLFKGMPGLKRHLGKLIVDELGADRTRLRWEVHMEFHAWHPFNLLLGSFLQQFEATLRRGVSELRTQLERFPASHRIDHDPIPP
jgi:hypothetical protein